MSVYDEKIWLAQYPSQSKTSLDIEFSTALDMFRHTVKSNPDADIIRYYDGRITARELESLSDAFASGIVAQGFNAGERVAIYAQNTPQFVIAQLGTWKAGGIAVSANPMYRERELKEILLDSEATVLVAMQDLYDKVAEQVIPQTSVRTVITTSEIEYQSANRGPLQNARVYDLPTTTDMAAMLEEHKGKAVEQPQLHADSVAFLTYTSGTTGPPKGAMTTHRNVVFNAQTYRDWVGLSSQDVILGVAPLFHITGLIGHIAVTLLTGATLVLMSRMEPEETIRTIQEQQATFTVGSITVFIALMNSPDATVDAFRSLTKVYSGGAPIPPSTIKAFEENLGPYIHNIYGLTETTSPSHGVPHGARAPVDSITGATSVGVPVYDTIVRIVDEQGNDLPAGEIGELVTTGPQVVAGYWNKPEATANALPNGSLFTGDVGYMDSEGWFYIVDRKKDQINASGFKVWPREVEDVLYEHEAVREAAVVGVPDEYRGETVKAFVSLQANKTATPEELISHCEDRMAAYKYPRQVEILPDIPKTATGKLLRRQLRDA
jgi:long-chain acyl-CoA synthetase